MKIKKLSRVFLLPLAVALLSGCFPKAPLQEATSDNKGQTTFEEEKLNKLSFEEGVWELKEDLPTTREIVKFEKADVEEVKESLGIKADMNLISEESLDNLVHSDYEANTGEYLGLNNINIDYRLSNKYLPLIDEELIESDLPGISVDKAKEIAENILDNLNVSYKSDPIVRTVTPEYIEDYNAEGYVDPKNGESTYDPETDTFHWLFYKIALNDISLNEVATGDMYNSVGFGATLIINENGLFSLEIIGGTFTKEKDEPLSNVYSLEQLRNQLITSFDKLIGVQYVKVTSLDVVYLLKSLDSKTLEGVFVPYYRVGIESLDEGDGVKEPRPFNYYEYYSVEDGSVYED